VVVAVAWCWRGVEDSFTSSVTFSAESAVEGVKVKEDYGYDDILFSARSRRPKVRNSFKKSCSAAA